MDMHQLAWRLSNIWDPTIWRFQVGAIVLGVVLIVGASLFAVMRPRFPTNTGDTSGSPMWVARYIITAFGVMFIVGALTIETGMAGAYAVLSFMVTLFALSGYRMVKNIRAGGYGGEEEIPKPPK